jgi:phosphoribosylglycinamide formyltransferase-1
MIHVALFASGTGSNVIKIIEHFAQHPAVRFSVLSNKADAPVLAKATALGIETFVFDKKMFTEQTTVVDFLQARQVKLIVLAGFLWLVPESLVLAFPNKIINIHPALLPKFGGKGMYGMRVHQAVREANETESGITIHFVNTKYDEGKIILQVQCPVYQEDTPEVIAKKVQTLEHTWLPKVIEELL